MSTIRIENIPQTWDDQDVAFFRIVAQLFPADFVYGAGVLLATYDDDLAAAAEDATTADTVAAPSAPRVGAPAYARIVR